MSWVAILSRPKCIDDHNNIPISRSQRRGWYSCTDDIDPLFKKEFSFRSVNGIQTWNISGSDM